MRRVINKFSSRVYCLQSLCFLVALKLQITIMKLINKKNFLIHVGEQDKQRQVNGKTDVKGKTGSK